MSDDSSDSDVYKGMIKVEDALKITIPKSSYHLFYTGYCWHNEVGPVSPLLEDYEWCLDCGKTFSKAKEQFVARPFLTPEQPKVTVEEVIPVKKGWYKWLLGK